MLGGSGVAAAYMALAGSGAAASVEKIGLATGGLGTIGGLGAFFQTALGAKLLAGISAAAPYIIPLIVIGAALFMAIKFGPGIVNKGIEVAKDMGDFMATPFRKIGVAVQSASQGLEIDAKARGIRRSAPSAPAV